MNKHITFLLALFALGQLGCVSAQPAQQLKVTVRDDHGVPIEAAEVSVHFRAYKGDPEIKTKLTDEDGFVQITGDSPLSPNVIVSKEGFYESRLNKVSVVTPETAKSLLASKSFDITLREKRNPRPLIAKYVRNMKIPLKDEWVGYDLELGDWVEPHGNGERVDLRFRYSNKFLGLRISEENLRRARELNSTGPIPWTEERERKTYGKWSGDLEISFPGEKEGVLVVNGSNGYVRESELRMPHLAPEDGYEASISWNDVRNGQIMLRNGDGYFLRLRVRERNGQILEANYAKINKEVQFHPLGKVTFSYCLNLDVNDRNLEFNTRKNLLKTDVSGEQVILP